ncbi:MAG: Anti-sigma F factor [Phycisphaerae bacterium]|nr:Anti-sigma F factor [Phycisphaerae bacterium]
MNQPAKDQHLPLQTLVIPSDLAMVSKVEGQILQQIEQHHYSDEAIFAIKLTLEEALTNAIKHGNKCCGDKQVIVRFHVDEEQFVVYIRDEGPGFNPDAVPDPTSPDRLSLPSGRGILLMRAYMDEVAYLDDGRELYIRKWNRP